MSSTVSSLFVILESVVDSLGNLLLRMDVSLPECTLFHFSFLTPGTVRRCLVIYTFVSQSTSKTTYRLGTHFLLVVENLVRHRDP